MLKFDLSTEHIAIISFYAFLNRLEEISYKTQEYSYTLEEFFSGNNANYNIYDSNYLVFDKSKPRIVTGDYTAYALVEKIENNQTTLFPQGDLYGIGLAFPKNTALKPFIAIKFANVSTEIHIYAGKIHYGI